MPDVEVCVGKLSDGEWCLGPEDIETYPFASPPYSMRQGSEGVVAAAIRNVLFGGVEGQGWVVGWEEEVPWGGSAWDPGREWWGCYCWVVLRALAPDERASEWAATGSDKREQTLAMLKVIACTTD